MPVDEGFAGLTGHYLGQDWDMFGASGDEALRRFARNNPEEVPDAITGFERLIDSSMTEQELIAHWSLELHAGYDPRGDGYTFREWFTHALEILRAEAARQGQ